MALEGCSLRTSSSSNSRQILHSVSSLAIPRSPPSGENLALQARRPVYLFVILPSRKDHTTTENSTPCVSSDASPAAANSAASGEKSRPAI